MYYFKCNGNQIDKYHVIFNKDEVKKLNQKIIQNCSFIEHKECDSDYSPRFDDINLIKNLHSTFVGKKEYYEETRDLYHYSYDEYKPPYLVKLIKKLLNDDVNAIDQILNYDITPETSIDNKIKIVNQEFTEIADNDIVKKRLKLDELEKLLKSKDLNKNQQNICDYYEQLINLIDFNLVDSLELWELNRVESFLGIKLSSELQLSSSQNSRFEKILKK